MVKGLLIECPMGTPVGDCPAGDIRELPIEKRLDIVDQMSDHDVNGIIAHHEECLQKRVSQF